MHYVLYVILFYVFHGTRNFYRLIYYDVLFINNKWNLLCSWNSIYKKGKFSCILNIWCATNYNNNELSRNKKKDILYIYL